MIRQLPIELVLNDIMTNVCAKFKDDRKHKISRMIVNFQNHILTSKQILVILKRLLTEDEQKIAVKTLNTRLQLVNKEPEKYIEYRRKLEKLRLQKLELLKLRKNGQLKLRQNGQNRACNDLKAINAANVLFQLKTTTSY
tara:strand:- start:393 stop:812 length:420 start_codon:yes stop_codon:yes gene_type:complete